MTEKAKKPAKVFDIAKPGKSAPSASAKPIIVTNRPVLQDPMVVDDSTASETPGAPSVPSTKIKIQPIHDDVKPEDDTTPGSSKDVGSTADTEAPAERLLVIDDPKPTKNVPKVITSKVVEVEAAGSSAELSAMPPADEQPIAPTNKALEAPVATPKVTDVPEANVIPVDAAKDEEKPAASGEDKPATSPGESIATEKKDEPVDTTPAPAETSTGADKSADETVTSDNATTSAESKVDEKTERHNAERIAELDKLVESHKYYLPINQVEKRKNKQYAIIGLIVIILLAAVWADIALDAGIIHISGVKPLTHFFSK